MKVRSILITNKRIVIVRKKDVIREILNSIIIMHVVWMIGKKAFCV